MKTCFLSQCFMNKRYYDHCHNNQAKKSSCSFVGKKVNNKRYEASENLSSGILETLKNNCSLRPYLTAKPQQNIHSDYIIKVMKRTLHNFNEIGMKHLLVVHIVKQSDVINPHIFLTLSRQQYICRWQIVLLACKKLVHVITLMLTVMFNILESYVNAFNVVMTHLSICFSSRRFIKETNIN